MSNSLDTGSAVTMLSTANLVGGTLTNAPNEPSSREDSRFHLPSRMFALGEEPVGERVNAYHFPTRLRSLFQVIDQEEKYRLKGTFFGPILEKMGIVSYSGRFGHYLLTKQLMCRKVHEFGYYLLEDQLGSHLGSFIL